MKPSIPHPCSQSWDDMKIGLVSRHCDSCRKDVMDFTHMQRHEILKYLIENRNREVCAHVFPSQLDYKHEEILITIRSLEKKYRNTNLSFYLLTLATLSLMACESVPPKKHASAQNKQEIQARKQEGGSSVGKENIKYEKPDMNSHAKTGFIAPEIAVDGMMEMVPPPPPPIQGETIMIFDPPEEVLVPVNEPRIIVEIMPEFKGGTEALMAYVKDNLKYPEWEQENDIQGTVYASFVIDAEGKVSQPKILRSVSGSKNFDAEVIRVIKGMPDWKPGMDKGVPTPVKYNLPFRFKKV